MRRACVDVAVAVALVLCCACCVRCVCLSVCLPACRSVCPSVRLLGLSCLLYFYPGHTTAGGMFQCVATAFAYSNDDTCVRSSLHFFLLLPAPAPRLLIGLCCYSSCLFALLLLLLLLVLYLLLLVVVPLCQLSSSPSASCAHIVVQYFCATCFEFFYILRILFLLLSPTSCCCCSCCCCCCWYYVRAKLLVKRLSGAESLTQFSHVHCTSHDSQAGQGDAGQGNGTEPRTPKANGEIGKSWNRGGRGSSTVFKLLLKFYSRLRATFLLLALHAIVKTVLRTVIRTMRTLHAAYLNVKPQKAVRRSRRGRSSRRGKRGRSKSRKAAEIIVKLQKN